MTAGLLGSVLLVLLARSVIDHPVHYDELLHVLSARGLVQGGIPAIADGQYTRAEFFTRAVAWSFRRFGESPVAARVPALVSGVVLMLVVGTWAARRAGFLAGVAAALLLCVVPTTVDVAVFARFYTVHALIMTLMFISAYAALEPGRPTRTRVIQALLAVALVPLGWHFQETAIIAAGAVVAAVVAVLALDHWSRILNLLGRQPVLTLGALGFGVLLGLSAIGYLGLLDQLGRSALWAAGNAGRYQYYLVEFRNDLPLLWPLLPAAAVLAVLHPAHRRFGLFCAVAVASALAVHSVAAQKTMRYAYYLAPLMCVLWAMALSSLTAAAGGRDEGMVHGGSRGRLWLVWALIAVTFLLSQEGARTLNLLAGRIAHLDNRPFSDEPDWTPLVPGLGPFVHTADRVVTSNSMKALYYLGRYDYELNATIVPETETRTEFGRDRRTGRQAIGTAESIRQVLDRSGQTLVVIEESKIGRFSGVSSEAFAVIESRCGELTLPAGSGVRAWWCERSLQAPADGPLNTR
jgi:hypothetical protein